MFHKLIQKKCDEWINSPECTIRELLQYISKTGKMRDAQFEAIKTFLFLKIACGNRPLWELFSEGIFNDTNIGQVELTETARDIFKNNKAAVALFQYARLEDKNGRQLAPALEAFIKSHADEIDYSGTFRKIFYGVEYTDYLFSLPMGAGKTYLMAAFIYLDLYFAQNEPDNPAFAHNFMVFAPSGLKSSIIPSLKHIKEFDPSWIIPEPTATQLKRLIKFEILDEQKTANKSNRIKNPNAQKINNHQPLEDLMGLVAITNAEKVILDRVDKSEDATLFSDDENYKIKLANELRTIIGKLPNLAIYIDEVHHAADGEIKLRQVVNDWTTNETFNSVLGFSGTPYLERAEDIILGESFHIRNTDLANVVYYYPLINGIGNFLKEPNVKFSDSDTEMIVRNGVEEFLDKYKDTVYPNNTCAKLAIYCGKIETLEEHIYPLVAGIVSDYGLEPTQAILKYHAGNDCYSQPEGSETEFASLDTPLSQVKIVLLVQIGKEGWDCKSLTGVILPQRGVCPTNMVLQTSCRCLRQIQKGGNESALIWLNKFNADTLNKQLKQQQNITLQEFNNKRNHSARLVERYSRMEKMNVPPIDFYQLKVSYQTLIVEDTPDVSQRLQDEALLQKSVANLIHQQDMEGNIIGLSEEEQEDDVRITFSQWLQLIAKESFNTCPVAQLKKHASELKAVFRQIVVEKDGENYFNHKYNQQEIRSLIRQAFLPKRTFETKEEIIPAKANLLRIESLSSPVEATDDRFYPSSEAVEAIIEWDAKPSAPVLTDEVLKRLEELNALGIDTSALMPKQDPHPEREKTFHYLPYHFDSGLEVEYFKDSILPYVTDKNLEVYFNGDDTLTEFKIDCFCKKAGRWQYIGKYVPDFLLLSRNSDNEIHKVIIIETKGEGFAAKFAERKEFMRTFIQKNNEKFGYSRFDFLYLEDTMSRVERERRTIQAIDNFFND
ncbi:MAG: DEAD/DEAH box helicase family protein [Prevotella sp.]|nr:DEAD/DEAH box helicase family protein [Prevotella sp.]